MQKISVTFTVYFENLFWVVRIMFEFGIEDIKRNWIWIKFKDELDEVIIDHSLLSGCDAPSILLKLLCELFIENKCEKYIAFHGESNI